MFNKIIILFYYLKTKYFQHFADRATLLNWQKKKIKRFLPKIISKSPFYQKYFQGKEGAPLETLPLINKEVMMTHFDEFNTASIKLSQAMSLAEKAEADRNFTPKLGRYSVGLSSGTSGRRGVFLISPFEQGKWCGTILGKMLPGSIFEKQKIAFFLRADNNLYESIKSRRINFKFFDLKKDPAANLQRLHAFQPDILAAPPQMLRLITQAQERGDISISPIKIISVADVLYADLQAKMERVFKQKIHQVYQATEGLLGCTCQYGNLHLNEDILAVRKKYIDKQSGRFIPIITDFNRTTQPIINYELNDILIENTQPCPCGSPFLRIQSIEGRADDILVYKDKTGAEKIVFPDFIVRALLKHLPAGEEFLFEQQTPSQAVLYLSCPVDQDILLQALHSIIPIQITIRPFEPCKDLSLKQKRVKRNFIYD